MRQLFALPLALSALLVSACGPSQEQLANGDDPIAALGSTVESSRYGAKYWTEQMNAASDLVSPGGMVWLDMGLIRGVPLEDVEVRSEPDQP